MKSVLQGFRRMTALLLLLLLGPLEIHAQVVTPAKSQPPATILIMRRKPLITYIYARAMAGKKGKSSEEPARHA
jgi:hypothetical protein